MGQDDLANIWPRNTTAIEVYEFGCSAARLLQAAAE
jgi:hypothetical protein